MTEELNMTENLSKQVELNHLFGHILPGTFFLIYSIWWLIRSMQMYFHNPDSYRNTTYKPCCCQRGGCCGRVLVEAVILICVVSVAAAIEIYTGYNPGKGIVPGNVQHVTMYSAFGTASFIQILVHRKVSFIPAKSDYMALIVALLVELVLFRFHLHGRAIVDVHVHMLLVYTIMATVVVSGIEMCCDSSIQAAIARSYCFMLQGWWFYSLAFLLYTPGHEIDVKENENIMYVTLVFAWNIIGSVLFCLLLVGLTYWCGRRNSYRYQVHTRDVTLNLLSDSKSGLDSNQNRANGYSYVNERPDDSSSES